MFASYFVEFVEFVEAAAATPEVGGRSRESTVRRKMNPITACSFLPLAFSLRLSRLESSFAHDTILQKARGRRRTSTRENNAHANIICTVGCTLAVRRLFECRQRGKSTFLRSRIKMSTRGLYRPV